MKHTKIKLALCALIVSLFSVFTVSATQTDINGPAGSGQFGQRVVALPNGNIVVADPFYDAPGPIVDVGAVYLYNGATGALVSALTGGMAGDQIGDGGITALMNSSFVVNSSSWDNPSPSTANVGAVTWCNGTTGCSGTVSAANSLIGDSANDVIGSNGIIALTNGNYVVNSPNWDNASLGSNNNAGAVTWGNGTGGTVGVVSSANSLIGGSVNDHVGSNKIITLMNGNYVVSSPSWDNPSLVAGNNASAVTWGNGVGGTVGVVSSANSLVGGTVNDFVGNSGIIALANGNYVVSSFNWDNPSLAASNNAGAATWGNGEVGTVGVVSSSNSLIGGSVNDFVGGKGIIALTNGNYVVSSPNWNNPSLGANNFAGAATWGNGAGGTVGVVSSSNSLIGGSGSDNVGNVGSVALANGNYVVTSPNWDNPSLAASNNAGAATWGNGTGGTVGVVSSANSLVGSSGNDFFGSNGVIALTNGNYVVNIPYWDNPSLTEAYDAGAATWGNGAGGTVGVVSSSNSLVGGMIGDRVSSSGIIALTNGNYVVSSVFWNNPLLTAFNNAGAATWGNGVGGTVGVVSSSNSLVGSTAGDNVGGTSDTTGNNTGGNGIIALANGNYVVRSPIWDNPSLTEAYDRGAVTWGNGAVGMVGVVSSSNSLVGGTAFDNVGSNGIIALANGNYVVRSPVWNNPTSSMSDAGAISYGSGGGGMVGLITANNSVPGTTSGGGSLLSYDFDAVNNQLVVGRPLDNIVSLFKPTSTPKSRKRIRFL